MIQHSLESHSHSIKTQRHIKKGLCPRELNRSIILEHYKNSKFTKPDDFIWPNKSGGSLNESLVNHRFTQSIKKLGLRKIRLYDLRHGHITETTNDGVPDKQIQERVGHSSANYDQRQYGTFWLELRSNLLENGNVRGLKYTAASEPGASDRI